MPPEDKQQLLASLKNDVQTSSEQKAKYQAPLNFTPEESENKIVQAALDSLDEFFATPMANVKAIGEDFGFKVYNAIDASNDILLRDSLLTGIGVFTLSIGAYVAAYRKLRNLEKASHFFYFKCLLESKKSNEVLKLMGESKFEYAVLSAAAHFYSPDISKFVAWKRRIFCLGDKRKELERLQDLWLKKGTNKQKVLEEIFLEIIKKVVIVLNEKSTDSDGLKFEHKNYTIELTESYREKIFSEAKDTWGEIEIRKNPSFGSAFLSSLGETSFIYWLVVFLFCFIPVGIVGAVAWPPLVIAGGFLVFKLSAITYQFLTKSTDKNGNVQNIESRQKEIFERNLVELNKRETFISFIADHIPSVSFKGSQLHKELHAVLNKRRFSKIYAALQGVVEGCFLPFFVIWVLSDFAKVLIAITIGASVMGPGMPIAIGVAIATLVLGIGYGIYLANKAVSAQEARYERLMDKIKCLEEANIQIPDLSLQAYDRLLRRYSLEEPPWTRVKKALNRGWVIIKRLGTGSLIFRLVIWGTVTVCTVVPAALAAPVSIPFIIGFAVIFAACYYRAYNVESELKQAENIVDLHYTRLMVEKGKLSVSAREDAAQASVVNMLQGQEVEYPIHLDNKLPPVLQNIVGLMGVSAQKVANSVASTAVRGGEPVRDAQKLGTITSAGFFTPITESKSKEGVNPIIVEAKESKTACRR